MKYKYNHAVIVLLLSHLLHHSWRTQLEMPKSGLYTDINRTEIVVVCRVCLDSGDPTEDFLGKLSCTGVVCHCLLLKNRNSYP
jgi:hypothetical protein